ncbi:MAG: hypothetical protein ACR2NO_01795 [Chloroflexota bacterium]
MPRCDAVGMILSFSALAALIAGQLTLLISAEPRISAAADAALRTAGMVWSALTLLSVVSGRVAPKPRPAWPVARLGASGVVAGTVALLVLALQRSPERTFLNVVGYLGLAVPLSWVVYRGAGAEFAARAALALGVLALISTRVNLPPDAAFDIAQAKPDSLFRWTVGFPIDGWTLRQQFTVRRSSGVSSDSELLIPLAGPYDGTTRVIATIDGMGIGQLDGMPRGFLQARIPAATLAIPGKRTLELRLSTPDPGIRLIAQRWTAGATLAAAASSYHDGAGWRPGTFNDLGGGAQPGVYVMHIR